MTTMRMYFRCPVSPLPVRLLLLSLLLPIAGVEAGPAPILSPENKGMVLQAEDLAVRAKLKERIDALSGDPELARKVKALGQRRTIFCNACHGENGQSIRPEVPNLAGQSPIFLLDQFQRFADGRRYDFAMSALSGSFSAEEKVMLALYYSRMQRGVSGGGAPAQVAQGETLYTAVCAECHGESGTGEKGYAVVAGQRPTYVMNMLKEFRNSTGRRSNPWMTAVTLRLSDQEIENVAYYIANMR